MVPPSAGLCHKPEAAGIGGSKMQGFPPEFDPNLTCKTSASITNSIKQPRPFVYDRDISCSAGPEWGEADRGNAVRG